jgi:hypothetical protein
MIISELPEPLRGLDRKEDGGDRACGWVLAGCADVVAVALMDAVGAEP